MIFFLFLITFLNRSNSSSLKRKPDKNTSPNIIDNSEYGIQNKSIKEIQGPCGDSLKFEIVDDTITISGIGQMKNYSLNDETLWFTESSTIFNAVIDDGVTSIGSYAFYKCIYLSSISIPESVTIIGSYAFRECSSLTEIVIPNNVYFIGEYAFNLCKKLETIKIPEKVTTIEESLFYNCNILNLVDLQGNITSIGIFAFTGCYMLSSIEIPKSVTFIGEQAFNGCGSIEAITIPKKVTTLENSIFDYCTGLRSIKIEGNLTSIGNYAFRRCLSLESIEIPKSVTYIGEFAFKECSALESVTIPENVETIGSCAFFDCSLLNSVTFLGTNSPNCDDDIFNTQIVDNIYVTDQFVDQNFCQYSVNVIQNSGISSENNDQETGSVSLISNFSSINSFSVSFAPQTFDSQIHSYSLSYLLTYIQLRSVSLSLSFSSSNSFIISYLFSDETYILVNSDGQYQYYFPYIIFYLSPSYIPTYVYIEIIKKRISQEQMIGIVCGSVSVFFLILYIIIFVVRKIKYKTLKDIDEWKYYLELISSSDSIEEINDNQEKNDKKEESVDKSYSSDYDVDFWI